MKVTIETPTEKEFERRDYRGFLTIKIDGKNAFFVCDGEPEDANLGRNFNDCYKISDLMKRAYDAGIAGEPFDVEDVESEG